ncbi:MAG: DUF2313 domain-containing protein [Xanthomonadaceae bacterium]|nr:DUF2313 domain-containing protein [Xanthomonadaceae bacterium]
MRRLGPPGDAVSRDVDTSLEQMRLGFADTMAALHATAAQLSEVEADPGQTMALLPAWEASFGLPDPCLGPSPTIQQRRGALLARLLAESGAAPTPAYFIGIAAALGYTITISTFQASPFGRPFGGPFGDGLAYTWQINGAALHYQGFQFGSAFGEPFAVWGTSILQCVLNRLKPAHTVLLFQYT